MHELIEGLNGVEVIVDDFVVVGYGDSLQAASKDHDKSLSVFLQRCDERGVHLNIDKLKLRMREVPFIGHVATSQGLRADPAKVRAIRQMPRPENGRRAAYPGNGSVPQQISAPIGRYY